jgi:hypothetical protein
LDGRWSTAIGLCRVNLYPADFRDRNNRVRCLAGHFQELRRTHSNDSKEPYAADAARAFFWEAIKGDAGRSKGTRSRLTPAHDGGLPHPFTGSAPTLPVSRLAQRSLTLRPACSQSRPRRPFPSKASAVSLPPLPLRLLPAGATSCRVGIAPTEDRHLFTAHKGDGYQNAIERTHASSDRPRQDTRPISHAGKCSRRV